MVLSHNFWLQPLGKALGGVAKNVAQLVAAQGEVREGFLERTGFQTLYHVEPETTGIDLALDTLKDIDQDWLRSNVDTLIYITSTGNRHAPGNGHLLHGILGLAPQTLVLDINDACTGFVRSLILSDSLLTSGRSKTILLVLSDTYSKLYPESNLKVSPLFSDGASAMLISTTQQVVPGSKVSPRHWEILGTSILSEGSLADELTISNASKDFPFGELEMNGAGVFNFVVKHLRKTVTDVLSEAHLDLTNVNRWYVHQGSRAVVDSVSKAFDLDADFQFSAKDYGNVVGSAIPFQIFDEDYSEDEVSSNLLLIAFGVGLTIAGAAIRQIKISD